VVTAISDRAFQLSEVLQRTARFFSAIATNYEDDNEIEREDKTPAPTTPEDETPSAALQGMYSECVLRLSVPCIQRKLMLFLDRLGRIDKFRLLGDFLSVVRVEPRNAGDYNYTSGENNLILGSQQNILPGLLDYPLPLSWQSQGRKFDLGLVIIVSSFNTKY